ncbi:hypothetical protein EYV94_26080 [Puteibacter caeruleilacunae]|nr:hypothetical protein EYV94_26080 [Puteibacter caeruleilacunae]
MKELFFMGGPQFMSILTILLIITTAWIIYHFVVGYKSDQPNPEKLLRKIGYGKSIGLFALITGFLGQMIGFVAMFSAIEQIISNGSEAKPELIFGAIKVTMICPIFGILIYLFTISLWFIASMIIEKKFKMK